jgi:Fic/DOC family
MENQVITGSELPVIRFTLTDDYRKQLSIINERIMRLTTDEKEMTIKRQIVPERISQAFHYVQQIAERDAVILSQGEICNMNKLLGCAGSIRKPSLVWFDENNIGINGYHPPTDENIETLFNEYLQQHTLVAESENSLQKICSAYFVFEQIHPFSDGNGRTGRLICAWLMFKYGYGFLAPHLEIRWGNESKQHASAFKSNIHHYLAWLTHQDYFNVVFNRFFGYFLEEIMTILDNLMEETA